MTEPLPANSWSKRILSPFQRVTTSGAFISEIDGLRFIAIGTVLLFHLMVNLSFKSPVSYAIPTEPNFYVWISRWGFRGVELFFIISGFILATPFAAHYLKGKKKTNLKKYFLRRLTRLEPPYMICLLLYFAARVGAHGESASTLFPHLGASLVYLHNLIFHEESLINNVAWSLEIEIQFYILVPLLSHVFAIRSTLLRRGLIIGTAAAFTLHAWFFIDPTSWMYLTIIRFLQFFLAGFLLADVYLVNWNEQPARTWRWDLVSLVGWPLLFVLWNSPDFCRAILPGGADPGLSSLAFPAFAFLLYVAVFRGSATNRIMTNIWITTIGGMCYTIYLFHNQLIGIAVRATGFLVPTGDYTLNMLIQVALVMPPVLLACGLYFILVERPCMRSDWPKRFAERVRTIAGTLSPHRAPVAPDQKKGSVQ